MLNLSINMITILTTFIVLSVALLAMAIGIIFSNRELKGSCGGEKLECTCNSIEKKLCKIKVNASNLL